MSDPYIGEIRAFGFNFAPIDWTACDGKLLSISQYPALYSAIGTTYGGDGQTTFAVPNLNGSAIIGQGNGPGLTPRPIGTVVGEPSVTLLVTQIPNHDHVLTGRSTSQVQLDTAAPAADSMISRAVTLTGSNPPATMIYSNVDQVNTTMSPLAVGVTGGSQPHDNQQPYLTLNYCMSLLGIFPPPS